MPVAPFSLADFDVLVELVSVAWTAGADRDWSVPAGTLEWTCLATADHAVDCVAGPALMLASRKLDGYPDYGWDFTMGSQATPRLLVEGLATASRFLAGVVTAAEPEARATIWRRPAVETRPPADFVPRAGLELILHAHDVCAGLAVPFEPSADLCERLREHTRGWPMWQIWQPLPTTDDAWRDLLRASGRRR
jgi:hypothetical protein